MEKELENTAGLDFLMVWEVKGKAEPCLGVALNERTVEEEGNGALFLGSSQAGGKRRRKRLGPASTNYRATNNNG